jgi:hypothetical protein
MCFAVYINPVLFVLFLLVMRIWVDLQVLEIWDLDLHSNLGKPSLAKPSQAGSVESPPGSPQSAWLREDVDQSTFGKRPGWTHSQHPINAIAAQVCLNKQYLANYPVNNITI